MGSNNGKNARVEAKCKIKRPYDKLADAFAAVNRVKGYAARDMGAYECPHCGRYHIGHNRFGYPMRTLPYFGA